MKKLTTRSYVILACLLIVAFAVGTVFAQGDTPSSGTRDSGLLGNNASTESLPGSNLMTGSNEVYSSNEGKAPNQLNTLAEESAFHLMDSSEAAPATGSNDFTSEPQVGSTLKTETRPASDAENPNAPSYNTTLRFTGSTLRPRASGVEYSTNGSGGCMYVTGGNPLVVWNLPLALPSGAQVEWLRMYYYDNNPASAMWGYFSKYDLNGNLVNEWGVSSTDGGNGYRDVEIIPNETIDYEAYSYVLNWIPSAASSDLRLCGFRLYYTQYSSTFMPLLVKP